MLATNLFAKSTTKRTKQQITLPPEDQYYNCKSKNVIYLATCNHRNCAAQYIGYTTRSLRDRIFVHLQTTNTSAIFKHCNEPNPDYTNRNSALWLLKLIMVKQYAGIFMYSIYTTSEKCEDRWNKSYEACVIWWSSVVVAVLDHSAVGSHPQLWLQHPTPSHAMHTHMELDGVPRTQTSRGTYYSLKREARV